jgi:long-chain fatty acid transport protein
MRLIFGRQAWLPHFPKRGWISVYASILVAAFKGIALGAGIMVYPTDFGTASAGQAAMAEDASTAASNPAGMTQLDRSQLLMAPGALLPSVNFDIAPETKVKGGGTSGGNAGVFLPTGSSFYVHKLSERLRLGVGLYSDYGRAGDYSTQWVGRYYITRAALFTGKIAPSIAYEVNNWLSVGAGFSFGSGGSRFSQGLITFCRAFRMAATR